MTNGHLILLPSDRASSHEWVSEGFPEVPGSTMVTVDLGAEGWRTSLYIGDG